MNSAVRIDTRGHVATVTLVRPEVRNAFNDEVIAQLSEAFMRLGATARSARSCWPPRARPFAPVPT